MLAQSGVASRRACEELIAAGQVKVNGEVISTQGHIIDPIKDVVVVKGKPLAMQTTKNYYFAVNKPKGYICR